MTSDMVPVERDSAGQLIWHLRKSGMSWVNIHEELLEEHEIDLSARDIAMIYRNFMSALNQFIGPDDRDQIVQLELDRLDMLQAAHWNHALRGDVNSTKAVLETMKVRHKLLGLDALNGADKNVQQIVLVAGEDTKGFIEALEHGSKQPSILTGVVEDDGEDTEED